MSVEDRLDESDSQLSYKKTNLKHIEDLKKEITKLNYEESIDALESILTKVQDENIPLDQIQNNYIKGNIIIKHCEKLLENTEQEISEINLDDFD